MIFDKDEIGTPTSLVEAADMASDIADSLDFFLTPISAFGGTDEEIATLNWSVGLLRGMAARFYSEAGKPRQ